MTKKELCSVCNKISKSDFRNFVNFERVKSLDYRVENNNRIGKRKTRKETEFVCQSCKQKACIKKEVKNQTSKKFSEFKKEQEPIIKEVKKDIEDLKINKADKIITLPSIKEPFKLTTFAGWWMFASIFLITVLWFWDNLVRFWNRPLEGELEEEKN